MNILYCGLKFDYGNKNMGFSFEHLNFYNSLIKMTKVNKVDYICIDEIILQNSKEFLNEAIINKAKKNKYDFIFFFFLKMKFLKAHSHA